MARKSSQDASFIDNVGGYNLQRNLGLLLFFVAVILIFSLLGTNSLVGNFIFELSTTYIGIYAYILPFLLLVLAWLLFKQNTRAILSTKWLLTLGLLTSIFLMLSHVREQDVSLGGLLGGKIATSLNSLIGYYPTLLILSLAGLTSLLALFEKRLHMLSFDFSNLSLANFKFSLPTLPNLSLGSGANEEDDSILEEEQDVRDEMFSNMKNVTLSEEEKEKLIPKKRILKVGSVESVEEERTKPQTKIRPMQTDLKYERPPLNLYEEDSGKPSAGDNKENARLIKRTMQNFGISVEMDEVSVGPTVTRYCLKPAQGVKLNRIAALDKNLAMELSTTTVRIEAPVPGKSVVGVEIPNKTKAMIGLGTMFADAKFQEDKRPLLLAIGKDIAGEPTYADLAKMPHLLVAGMTGAGKSVMVHTLIHSLIYRNSPEELKFIMIDPKKVELAFYQKLPHLYTPVIKEPKKAVQTLNWLVQEMERRYEVLEEHGKQNIGGYHALVHDKYLQAERSKRPVMEELPEKMPYIIVVIDELADFMMAYPKEMESGIVRLAQKSRAVGIHLILSTQKPLASIVSSVIKANVPGRIALKVSSRVDSMVIIDQIGAEKLLGYGDLLLVSSDGGDAKRIQSPNVTEKEMVRVIDFLRNKYNDYVAEDLVLPGANGVAVSGAFNSSGYGGDESQDDRFEEAKEIVLASKNASTTFLQRKMGVGYARAAKLIDALEGAGIIGPANGSKPREILVGAQAGSQLAQTSEELEEAADELLGEEDR
jgi:S-DNA-T family DNA segregation ATPase FtsK/SpoIIIE